MRNKLFQKIYHQPIVNNKYIFTFAARFKQEITKLAETLIVKGT